MQFPTHHSPHVVRTIWTIVILVVGFMLLAFVTFTIGLYGAGWHDRLTQRIVHVVPMPAASVNWQLIPSEQYFAQLQAMQKYQTVQLERAPDSIQAQSASSLRRATLRKILRDAVVDRILTEHKISMTQADINQAYTSAISQIGNRASAEQAIRTLYGWGPAEYKKNVIRSAVGREKLREYLSFSDQYNQASKRQADQVLKLVQAGETSFEDLAKKYSDDVYGASGGDTGFVRRGEEADEIDEVAFGLEIGKISDLVHTKFGFHILKVTERREVDGQLEIHLFQIFIAGPSVDDFITKTLKNSHVAVWVPGFRWDPKTADVVAD